MTSLHTSRERSRRYRHTSQTVRPARHRIGTRRGGTVYPDPIPTCRAAVRPRVRPDVNVRRGTTRLDRVSARRDQRSRLLLGQTVSYERRPGNSSYQRVVVYRFRGRRVLMSWIALEREGGTVASHRSALRTASAERFCAYRRSADHVYRCAEPWRRVADWVETGTRGVKDRSGSPRVLRLIRSPNAESHRSPEVGAPGSRRPPRASTTLDLVDARPLSWNTSSSARFHHNAAFSADARTPLLLPLPSVQPLLKLVCWYKQPRSRSSFFVAV